MTFVTTTRTLALALFVSLLGANPAVAEDDKRYAGSECVRFQGGPLAYWWSTISGPSSYVNVDCPIVRDNFHVGRIPDLKGILNRASVSFIDQHPYERFRCMLVAVESPEAGRVIGFSVGASNWDKLAVHSSQVQFMEFDASKQKIWPNNHAYLSCRIPSPYDGIRSSLNSYWVRERS